MAMQSPRSPPALRLDTSMGHLGKPTLRFECDEDMHGVFGRVDSASNHSNRSNNSNPSNHSNKSSQESSKDDAPTNLSPRDNVPPRDMKRRRILPLMFFERLPEADSETEDFDGDYETLARMKMARDIVFGDLEDREAERLRETADYYEGDTPHTSQESKLSDYLWSVREGGDAVPLDSIMAFVIKYLPRPRIFTRVAPFVSVTEELYERDPDRAMELVAHVLDCEPALLFNVLEDAIEIAEDMLRAEDA